MILLDSHALVWYLRGDKRMSSKARKAIETEAAVYVSAVTAWEIANKFRLGKWPEVARLAQTFIPTLDQFDWMPLPLTLEHAHLAGSLRGDHRDPFDRMLAAQSQIEDVPLVTADPVFKTFGTRTLW